MADFVPGAQPGDARQLPIVIVEQNFPAADAIVSAVVLAMLGNRRKHDVTQKTGST